jgi:mRNA interferase RelE/StbE
VSYRVALSREAEKILDRIDRATEQRLRTRLRELEANPFDPRISKLLTQARGQRSSRVGGWRIIFDVNQAEGTVAVSSIRPRGQAYRRL